MSPIFCYNLQCVGFKIQSKHERTDPPSLVSTVQAAGDVMKWRIFYCSTWHQLSII